jgi:hypothetical protein
MKRKTIVLMALALILVLTVGIAFIALRPGDQSQSCMEYYAGMENPPADALAWCQAGAYFDWESTLPVNSEFDALSIFYTCQGNPEDPAILLIHGYPTLAPVRHLDRGVCRRTRRPLAAVQGAAAIGMATQDLQLTQHDLQAAPRAAPRRSPSAAT